jgi:plastocyanin
MDTSKGLKLTAALAACAALAAGCGDDDEDSGEPAAAPAAASETIAVSAEDFAFVPENPRVAKAGRVTFEVTNDGKAPHALEVEGPSGEAETGEIAAGGSATLEVDLGKPGRYVMYCPVGNHRAMGMEGTITVAGGGSAGAAVEDDSGAGRGY